jgi:RNA recognition motif-containing protein
LQEISSRMAKLYVGNIPWRCTEQELEEHFSACGTVQSVAIIMDRETGRSRGFGFVEMDDAGARAAIDKLNGQDFRGRPLRVSEARERERESRPPRGRSQ